jgi:predicted DNA-binding ribbon-helix-helix protein
MTVDLKDRQPDSAGGGCGEADTDFRKQSTLVSRNLLVSGRRTSARLEPDMWVALFDVARREGRSIHEICSLINESKPQDCSLTAAIRVFITAYFRAAATEEGHARAGHGYGEVKYPEPVSMPRRFTLRNGTNGLPWR